MLITSEPIVNESNRGVQLLTENPISPPPKPRCQPVSEPRPRGRPRKRPHIENENKVEQEGFVEVEAPNESRMRTEGPHNQIQRPRTDLGKTLSKYLYAERLVISVIEFAKSVTEISSKVREPKT